MSDYTQATTEGKLSAASASGASVSDMMTDSTASSPNATINNTLATSNSGNDAASKSNVNLLNKQNAFVSQNARSIFDPISFKEDLALDTIQLNTMSDADIDALSKFSEMEISSDADLETAVGVLSSKLNEVVSSANIDLSSPVLASSAIVTDISAAASTMATSITKAASSITGIGDEVISVFNGLVPNITAPDGSIIIGMPDGADFDMTKGIIGLMSKICSNVSLDIFNFGYTLNLYNALLSLLAKLGLTGLLAQVIACSEYFGYDGESILKDRLPDISLSGDISTFDLVTSTLGEGTIPNVDKHIVTLSANMEKDASVSLIDSILTNTGVTSGNLTEKAVPNTTLSAISSSKISSLNNDSMSEHLIGSDTKNLFDALPFI